MSSPITPSSGSPQNNPAEINVTPGFEEKLRLFWEKNSRLILVACAAVLLAIVGRGVLEVMRGQKEQAIAAAYAAAGTSERAKAFAAEHEGHALAGAAHLRLADEAFQAGQYAEALAGYEKAAEALKDWPFAGRIRLGQAMARLHSGQGAAAETALKALADDTTQLKAVRAEAAYHLAVIAAEAGRGEEASRLSEQIMSIDPESVWTQRALMLRARTPVAASAAPAPSAPAEPAAAEAVPSVSFKVEGK